MPIWLGLLIVLIAVASRPIEVRLWRAGRISDRTVTILVLGRLPIFVAIAAIATGGPTWLTAALIGVSLVVPHSCIGGRWRWSVNSAMRRGRAHVPFANAD